MKTQQINNYERLMLCFSPVVNTGTCCLQHQFDSMQTIKNFYYSVMVFIFLIGSLSN